MYNLISYTMDNTMDLMLSDIFSILIGLIICIGILNLVYRLFLGGRR